MSFLGERLRVRQLAGTLRSLQSRHGLVDFASNDYLGLARRPAEDSTSDLSPGSTGSRLLTGNSAMAEALEGRIAAFHQAESALLFNSGYDANLGLISALLRDGDSIFYDEKSHASLRDGIQLGRGESFPFRHNDLDHLDRRLARRRGNRFVAVESIYSMDGDEAPLPALTELCAKHRAHLIVDEAHATGIRGVRGEGLVQEQGLNRLVFARVHTFGKALGCHGAAVVGAAELKEYLVNFARPLVYSTALPPQSLAAISAAYDAVAAASEPRRRLRENIALFRAEAERCGIQGSLLPSESPIQACLVPGAARARDAARLLEQAGFDARPIVSPTVARHAERIRICLHSYNSAEEIRALTLALARSLNAPPARSDEA